MTSRCLFLYVKALNHRTDGPGLRDSPLVAPDEYMQSLRYIAIVAYREILFVEWHQAMAAAVLNASRSFRGRPSSIKMSNAVFLSPTRPCHRPVHVAKSTVRAS